MFDVNKPLLFARLFTKFGLKNSEPIQVFKTQLSQTVVPITDFDALAKKLGISDNQFNIQSVNQTVTPPTGKRWTVLGVYREGTTAGAGVNITSGSGSFPVAIGTTSAVFEARLSYPLELNDTVQFAATGNAGDTNRRCVVIYLEEDAY